MYPKRRVIEFCEDSYFKSWIKINTFYYLISFSYSGVRFSKMSGWPGYSVRISLKFLVVCSDTVMSLVGVTLSVSRGLI
jgi:hypothetical protein